MGHLHTEADGVIIYRDARGRHVYVPGVSLGSAPDQVKHLAAKSWTPELILAYHQKHTELPNGAGPNTGQA
jgi:hypothetical protein